MQAAKVSSDLACATPDLRARPRRDLGARRADRSAGPRLGGAQRGSRRRLASGAPRTPPRGVARWGYPPPPSSPSHVSLVPRGHPPPPPQPFPVSPPSSPHSSPLPPPRHLAPSPPLPSPPRSPPPAPPWVAPARSQGRLTAPAARRTGHLAPKAAHGFIWTAQTRGCLSIVALCLASRPRPTPTPLFQARASSPTRRDGAPSL